jgi:hypothetical protein
MPGTNTSLEKLSGFVSIAVLSSLVITGGLWFYHNRGEIVGGAGNSSKDGTWFTRWAGIDHTKLKEHGSGFDFSEHATPFKSDLELDPDWLQKLHGGVQFDWDSSNR